MCYRIALIGAMMALMPLAGVRAERQVERIDHGLAVAVVDSGVMLSWRSLKSDGENCRFTLYRDGQRIARVDRDAATCFVDREGSIGSHYQIRIRKGFLGKRVTEEPFIVYNESVRESTTGILCPFKTITLRTPAPVRMPDGTTCTYTANDMSTADLDGDGRYELVVKWDPSNSKDNSHTGYTGPVYIDAYRMDGTFMWRIDLGRNIRAGAHYTQFMVYDLDGDGCAEVAMKTADGTVDGIGSVIGHSTADFRTPEGRILSGPEYLTVFDGTDGHAITTIDYYPPRDITDRWGDNYGNRSERMLAAVGYFDGEHPSLVMCRGYYTNAYVVAYGFDGKTLSQQWICKAESRQDPLYGQGNHNIFVGDIDMDGYDEIIYGGAAIDQDGSVLYSTRLGHGDAGHLGDLDPEHPGLEFWDVHEDKNVTYSDELRATDGTILWGTPQVGKDNGRGLAADIDPRYPGHEMWSNASGGIRSCKGELISIVKPSVNFRIYWDGDLLDELFDATGAGTGGKIEKWNPEIGTIDRLFTFAALTGTALNNGTKSNPCLLADLSGDWREEFIVRSASDPSEVKIFTTPYFTTHRVTCLMQDPLYRLAIVTQNVAYNQPPHLSYPLQE